MRQRGLWRRALFFVTADREARDHALVAASGLFDRDWYLDFWPELDDGADAILHFLRIGAAALTDPGPGFSMRGYRDAYRAEMGGGIDNPLLHFLRRGRARRLAPIPAAAGPAPFRSGIDGTAASPGRLRDADWPSDAGWLAPPPSAVRPPCRIAVVAHVYYPALWPAMTRYFANIPEPFDLYVSVAAPADAGLVAAIRHDHPGAAILSAANRGRDIRPFLLMLRRLLALDYEFVCKVHSKLSPKRRDGSGWRRDLFRGLLGGAADIRRVIDGFSADPALGLVAPAGYLLPLADFCCDGRNAVRLRQMADALGLDRLPQDTAFPGGTMFWARLRALAPAAAAPLGPDAFEPERGQLDGTVAHAWERFFGIVPAAAGYRVADTGELGRPRGSARRAPPHPRWGTPHPVDRVDRERLFGPPGKAGTAPGKAGTEAAGRTMPPSRETGAAPA